MKFIKQILAFEEKAEQEYLPGTAQLLWFKLFLVNNKCGWAEWFRIDNNRLMRLADISNTNTLIRNRDKLINNGFIEYRKGKKGQPSSYKIIKLYCNIDTENVTENRIQYNIDTKNVTENVTENVTHNKTKTKTETKKEKNILKKEKFAEFVELTAEEHQKLVDEYGESAVKCMITILDNYKGQSGRKYKSDYRAILNWVVKRAKEDYPREFMQKSANKYDDLPF